MLGQGPLAKEHLETWPGTLERGKLGGEGSPSPPRALWTALGGVLEASWSLGRLKGKVQGFMGRSWTLLGADKSSVERFWAAPKTNSKRAFSHLGGQTAPQMAAKMVPNGAWSVVSYQDFGRQAS